MNKRLLLKAALAERKRRKDYAPPDWSKHSFPAQWNFVSSTAFLNAAQCGRRSGKTSGAGLKFFKTAEEKPNTKMLFLAKTRTSAKRILVDDVLKPFARKLGVKLGENLSELSFTFPSGSQLFIGGVDQNQTEMDKLLGQKYSLVVIDEAAFFKQDLKKIVEEILMPAMGDDGGQIYLISTTSDYHGTYYYDIVTGKNPEWNVHVWNWDENPYMKDKMQALVDERIEKNPEIVNDPGFKQHFMNEWAIDDNLLIYRHYPKINLIDKMPVHDHGNQRWEFVLGVDLGWNDDTAFVLGAYRKHDKNLYICETYKSPHMDLTATAEMIKKYTLTHSCQVVIDGANKQGVEEMRNRHGLSLEIAEKTAKVDYIRLMNADFATGRIKIVEPACKGLIDEYENLIWDSEKKDKGKLEEDARCANHLCFVASTMIATPYGDKPIESLKVGDVVVTPGGTQKITHTMESVSDVLDVQYGEKTLRCTPDHPFVTEESKWEKAKNLNGKTLLPIEERYSTSMNMKGISKTQKEAGSIDGFGHVRKDLSLKAITSTIETMTDLTTPLKILSACQQAITWSIMPQKDLRELGHQKISRSSIMLDHLQQNGTQAKKVARGISSIMRITNISCTEKKRRYAQTVEKNTKKTTEKKKSRGAAPLNVLQQKEEGQALMISSSPVRCAEQNSKQISTKKGRPVVTNVTSIIGQESVFNITVENEHVYYANGVLVSNCDSALYMWRYALNYIETQGSPTPIIETWEDKLNKKLGFN